jgi:hypothetical protein
MKKVKSKFQLFAIGAITLAVVGLGSCSKSNSNSGGGGGGTTPPPPSGPTPINGYVSSDSVAASALIAYWNFDGNSNDSKGGLTATATPGVTYVAGLRGQAYKGDTLAYAELPAGHAFDSLKSFSVSVWYEMDTLPLAGKDKPFGMFFLSGKTNGNLLLLETEPYKSVTGDSAQIHNGFQDVGGVGPYQNFTLGTFDSTATKNWVHFVMTYDGPSSTYVVYQDGVPSLVTSAFSTGAGLLSTVLMTNNPGGVPLGNLSYVGDGPQSITIGTWPPGLYGVSPTLGSTGCYTGKLDELRVFSRAINQAEVAGLFGNGKAGR